MFDNADVIGLTSTPTSTAPKWAVQPRGVPLYRVGKLNPTSRNTRMTELERAISALCERQLGP